MIGHEQMDVTATVNGAVVTARVEVRTLLSDLLRDGMGLSGTHVACEHGVCGACTVIVDDLPVRACLMLAAQINGARVQTVESLGTQDNLSPLQSFMWEQHGLQCGFCTSGILMSVEGSKRAGMSAEEIVTEILPGHVCRCTGYQNIRSAIEAYFSEGGEA